MGPVIRTLYLRFIFALVLSFLLWFCYLSLLDALKNFTQALLAEQHPTQGISSWIYQLYPRLTVEKQRFDEQFFYTKVQQVSLRLLWTLQLALLVYACWPIVRKSATHQYNNLLKVSIHTQWIRYMTAGLYTCLILVAYNAIIEFHDLLYFRAFYQATGIGKLLLPVFPPLWVLWIIYLTLIGSTLLTILFSKWYWAGLAALSFLYYQLILFGFGKYDHGFSTLTYALLLYPFLLWEKQKKTSEQVPAWSVVLIQWMICLSYFYGGIEKLTVSGFQWFLSNNLQHHLLVHQTNGGAWLATHPLLCQALSFAVVILQCSFILIPFYPSLKKIILPSGMLFHFSTWFLLDAGGLFNPWWGVYLFFLFPLQPQETKSNPVLKS